MLRSVISCDEFDDKSCISLSGSLNFRHAYSTKCSVFVYLQIFWAILFIFKALNIKYSFSIIDESFSKGQSYQVGFIYGSIFYKKEKNFSFAENESDENFPIAEEEYVKCRILFLM